MTRKLLALSALIAAHLIALPANAQIGVPGSGPLTPDGPRRGLGPPSITDSVPDLRLQPSGAVPSYTPPSYQGGGYPSSTSRAPLARQGRIGLDNDVRRVRVVGRHCRTQKRTCLIRPAALETSCTCRLSNASRIRGRVVR
jgi:hypothetical protein